MRRGAAGYSAPPCSLVYPENLFGNPGDHLLSGDFFDPMARNLAAFEHAQFRADL